MVRKHYQKWFSGMDKPFTTNGNINIFVAEVASGEYGLQNGRTPGPDEKTSEDMERMLDKEIADTLISILKNQDNTLTNGYKAPIFMPEK